MKNNTKKISLADPAEKAKGIIFTVLSSLIELAALWFAIFDYRWWGLIIALVFPAFVYISIKYMMTCFARGVTLDGSYVTFEPEYKRIVKFHKNELHSIYVSDPGKGKMPDPETSYKNKYIVFALSGGKKENYPLSLVTKEMLDNLRNELL